MLGAQCLLAGMLHFMITPRNRITLFLAPPCSNVSQHGDVVLNLAVLEQACQVFRSIIPALWALEFAHAIVTCMICVPSSLKYERFSIKFDVFIGCKILVHCRFLHTLACLHSLLCFPYSTFLILYSLPCIPYAYLFQVILTNCARRYMYA